MLAASILACSSTAPPAKVIKGDDGGAESGDPPAWPIKPLGCGPAGIQSVVAVSGSTVAFASIAKTSKIVTCSVNSGGKTMKSPIAIWDVCYSASESGGDYKSQVVTSQPYIDATGVGLAFDSAGNPTIAFTGQGMPKSELTCGANNLFVTTLQSGAWSTPFQVSHGSMSNALIASQAGNCAENVCGEGDTTGFWPAIGFDPSNNTFIPYRDIHFGFAADDFAKSDVELAEGSGTSYQVLTIDVARGGGEYNRIAFDSAGLPAILQYNSNMTGMAPGVYLNRQTKSASFGAQQAKGVWTAQQIFVGQIGMEGQLGFAISSKGVYGVAYFDSQANLLMYTESMDAKTWSTPVEVDTIGYTGFYPSLAFDADDNPAIAYYRCNSVGPSEITCDPATDGLLLARRTGTAWNPVVVSADSSVTDGKYPALAFVKGKPVIAFQQIGYDPISKQSTITWSVAEAP